MPARPNSAMGKLLAEAYTATHALRRKVQTPSSISRDELNPYGATTQSDELQTQLQGKRGAK